MDWDDYLLGCGVVGDGVYVMVVECGVGDFWCDGLGVQYDGYCSGGCCADGVLGGYVLFSVGSRYACYG